MLKRNGKTPEEVSSFLFSNINVAYAIDIELLDAIRNRNGTRKYTRDKMRDRHIISVNRTQLRNIADTARESISNLGFEEEIGRWLPPNARRSVSRIVEVQMDDKNIQFELILLLRNGLKCRLLKQMNGAVKIK